MSSSSPYSYNKLNFIILFAYLIIINNNKVNYNVNDFVASSLIDNKFDLSRQVYASSNKGIKYSLNLAPTISQNLSIVQSALPFNKATKFKLLNQLHLTFLILKVIN